MSEPKAKVGQIVEHLFRQEAGKMISALTGRFGFRNLELVEDAVQEALLKAFRQWSFGSIPKDPAAWLMQVAKNRALDVLRRNDRWREKETEIVIEQGRDRSKEPMLLFSDQEIKDDQLRMMFACCHPALARESQIALTLKILGAFSVDEIARAFLLPSETIAKRLTRARERLRKEAVPFEIPSGAELARRLDSILDVLYLLFNEGYNASHGRDLIRDDLSTEALRLTALVQEHPSGDTPKTHALFALLLFQAARFRARIGAADEILLLRDQDRTAWDPAMISQGLDHLHRASVGQEVSEFHLQAGIAACHCTALTYEATDWPKILLLYDLLLQLNGSPVVALNRAVALAKVRGFEAGLAALKEIEKRASLENYYLFYAVLAEFQLGLNQPREAEKNLRHAISLTSLPAELNFLETRLRSCSK